jgi:hypothetical protein
MASKKLQKFVIPKLLVPKLRLGTKRRSGVFFSAGMMKTRFS